MGGPAEDLLGRSFLEGQPETEVAEIRRRLDDLTPRAPVGDVRQRLVLPGGRERCLAWTIRAIFDEGGCLSEYQATGRDITAYWRMTERTGVITFMGKGLTLVGKPVGVGDAAPAFTALTNELAPAGLADFSEKGLILIAVPSLDTAVCDLEARKFNKEMERLAGKAKAVVVSMLSKEAKARTQTEITPDHIRRDTMYFNG